MSVVNISDSDFQAVLEKNEPMVIKYFASWCGSCRLIAPKFKRLSENEDYTGISFYEVDAENNPEIRKWAGVTNLPFFTVQNGTERPFSEATSKLDGLETVLQSIKK